VRRHPLLRSVRTQLVVILASAFVAIVAAWPASAQTPGTLVPIGGGYSEASLEGFARIVATHASEPTVDILVVPAAYGSEPSIGQNTHLAQQRTDQIGAACEAIVGEFPGFTGCTSSLLPIFTRDAAMNTDYSARFEDAAVDGGFFLGGDQDLAMEIMAATPLEDAMADAYARGVVFGGTSAGDAVESRSMIWGFTDTGSQDNELEQGSVRVWWGDDPDLERGLIFGSTNTILDQHLYQMGRFGRLLNVIEQSDDRFGGASKLGAGVDFRTGVELSNDQSLSGVFGDSSVAIVDGETAGATHAWEGPNATLSARNILTHLLPSGDFAYDVAARLPSSGGQPIPFVSPGPWAPGLLDAPGPGALILGGDVSGDFTGPVMSAFVQRAQASGRSKIVEVFAGYQGTGAANHDAQLYQKGLVAAGWGGSLSQIVYGQHALSPADLAGAAGVLFVGGDQASLAGPVADASFRSFVQAAVAAAPVVMADHAMTAAMGQWYVAVPEPTPKTLQGQAIDDFQAGFASVQPGLGVIPGAAFEPRLTTDYRWGRLYSLSSAQPATIAFGISQGTAIVLDGGNPTATGSLSVVSADGRTGTFGSGDSGAIAAFNVVLNAYAPGDVVTSG
jgi:cyanophycinase